MLGYKNISGAAPFLPAITLIHLRMRTRRPCGRWPCTPGRCWLDQGYVTDPPGPLSFSREFKTEPQRCRELRWQAEERLGWEYPVWPWIPEEADKVILETEGSGRRRVKQINRVKQAWESRWPRRNREALPCFWWFFRSWFNSTLCSSFIFCFRTYLCCGKKSSSCIFVSNLRELM